MPTLCVRDQSVCLGRRGLILACYHALESPSFRTDQRQLRLQYKSLGAGQDAAFPLKSLARPSSWSKSPLDLSEDLGRGFPPCLIPPPPPHIPKHYSFVQWLQKRIILTLNSFKLFLQSKFQRNSLKDVFWWGFGSSLVYLWWVVTFQPLQFTIMAIIRNRHAIG